MLFLESMMPRKQFVELIFLSSIQDMKCIEYALRSSNFAMIKHLFSMPEVQDRYKNNDPMLFRLCIFLFVFNSDANLTKYVMSILKINSDKIRKMLGYQCPQQPAFAHNKKEAAP